jgi:hypothetical protein
VMQRRVNGAADVTFTFITDQAGDRPLSATVNKSVCAACGIAPVTDLDGVTARSATSSTIFSASAAPASARAQHFDAGF